MGVSEFLQQLRFLGLEFAQSQVHVVLLETYYFLGISIGQVTE